MASVDELVTSARAAHTAGDTLVARGYLRRAARSAPDRLDIWLDLCQVTERPEDRIECLQRIIELDQYRITERCDDPSRPGVNQKDVYECRNQAHKEHCER